MFKSISKHESEKAIKIIEMILERWSKFASENPTSEQRWMYLKAVCNLYRTPRSEIHERREVFRKSEVDEARDKIDNDMIIFLEEWKSRWMSDWSYADPVVLSINFMSDIIFWKNDISIYVAKEFSNWDIKNPRLNRTDEVQLFKSKTPKAFKRCKENLAPRWHL